MSDRPECAVAECYVPRQHETDCGDDRCTGCIPGLAMAGLMVCQHHRDQIARGFDRLPRLYAELAGYLAPYRSPQAPKGDGGRTSETPDVLNPAVYEIRREIERKFWDWSAYVATARHFTMPPATVQGMGRFLETSTDWLCNDPLAAPAIGARLQELLREATHLRNRSRASGLYLGACPITETSTTLTIDDDGRAHRHTTVSDPCGGAIRYDREEARASRSYGIPYQVTCPRCGTSQSWLWWQREIVGDVKPPTLLPAVRLAMILADTLAPELAAVRAKIAPYTIAKWKQAGSITPVACDLGSRRELYDRLDVEAFARDHLKLNPETRTA